MAGFVGTVIAVVIAAVIWWTSYNRLDEGYITAKSYSPAHTVRYISYIRVNKNNIPVWRRIHHRDRWTLKIENDGKVDHWEVSQEIYSQYKVGDWISRKQ